MTINTPLGEDQSCAIANFSIEGMKPDDIADALYERYRIFTVAINRESVTGVRVTPHLYTRLEQLDKLVLKDLLVTLVLIIAIR